MKKSKTTRQKKVFLYVSPVSTEPLLFASHQNKISLFKSRRKGGLRLRLQGSEFDKKSRMLHSLDDTNVDTVQVNGSIYFFDVLLTVHLSIFISVINQIDAQNFVFQ